ncbi:MAG: hypothetical protein HOV81_35745 [Kofleriaceae bacterium]|nr:hypothetical protein [Kofleriaceae bacterium]
MRLAFAFACVLTAGCYSPGYRDCEVTCTTGACPSGLSCEQGYCRVPGETASCSSVLADAGNDTMADAGNPFGTPVALTNDISVRDHDPSMTDNMLELYTSRQGAATEDIWRYARNQASSPFGTAAAETVSTQTQNEEGVDVSGDGTVMFFIRDGASQRDINMSTRPVGAPWSNGTPIPELDPGDNSANPSLSRDGLMIVFERLDETQYSLWQSTRTSAQSQWMPPQPIMSLPISGGLKPQSPMLSADKLTIYFHARGTSGSNDIFEAHRATVTASFGAPVPVDGVNTANEQEEDPWISADGKTIVFVRTQGNGTLIFTAAR